MYRGQVRGIRLNAKLFTYNQIEQTFLLIQKILLFKIFTMIIDIELVMVEIIVMTTDTISFKLCDERNLKKSTKRNLKKGTKENLKKTLKEIQKRH